MSELLVRPLSSYSYNDGLEEIGVEIHEEVNFGLNRFMLKNRHFPGVVDRYGEDEETAIDSLLQSWQASRRHMGFTAFLGFDSENDEFIGMGTVMEDLTLYKQLLPIPPKISRHYFSKKITSRIGERPNVAAWVTNRAYDRIRNPLESIYESVLSSADDRGWTLNPLDNDYTQTTHRDLTEVGFNPVDKPARYDDQVSGRIVPPKSQLYITGF